MCKKTKAGIILLLLILSLVITYIQAAELDSTASQKNKKPFLRGRHMVIVTGNGFADDELWLPKKIFEANGGRTAIASTTLNELRGMHQGTTVKAQTLVNDIDIDKLDVLMIYPSGISKYRYHKPTGQGVDYENIDITVNADTGQIQLEGAKEDTYILRIKSFTKPTTVRGLKDWSYDSKSKVLRLEVTGKKLDINIEGLRGY